MTTQKIDITLVDTNPWNRAIDLNYVETELAPSILKQGLLQAFRVRPHPTKSGRYQASFGNHRTEALKFLLDKGHKQFRLVELDVEAMTDLQMMDCAIAENDKRKALSAIERAEYIRKLTQPPFSLAQAEAGKRLGLTEAATSNIMRLLKLPTDIQTLVDAGELPERHARGLVTLSKSLPAQAVALAQAVAKAGKREDEDKKEFQTKDEAFSQGFEHVLDKYGRAIRNYGEDCFDLKLVMPITYVAESAGKMGLKELPACDGCEFFVKRQKWNSHCVRPGCFDLKFVADRWQQVAKAAKALGITPATPGELKKMTVLYDGKDSTHIPLARAALKVKHPSLRLVAMPGKDIASYYSDATSRKAFLGTHIAVLATTDLAALKKAIPPAALEKAAKESKSSRGGQSLARAQMYKAKEAQRRAEDKAVESMLTLAARAFADLLPKNEAVLNLLVDKYGPERDRFNRAKSITDKRLIAMYDVLEPIQFQAGGSNPKPAPVEQALRELAVKAGVTLPRDFGVNGNGNGHAPSAKAKKATSDKVAAKPAAKKATRK